MRCLCKEEQAGQRQSRERIEEYGKDGERKNKGKSDCAQISVFNYE